MIWEKGAVATILFLCSCSLNFMAQIISEPGTGKSIIKYVIYSTLPWSFISKPYSWYLSKTSLMLKQSRMVWGKRRKNEAHLFNFFSLVVCSSLMCYPRNWLVWRTGLALKWIVKVIFLHRNIEFLYCKLLNDTNLLYFWDQG